MMTSGIQRLFGEGFPARKIKTDLSIYQILTQNFIYMLRNTKVSDADSEDSDLDSDGEDSDSDLDSDSEDSDLDSDRDDSTTPLQDCWYKSVLYPFFYSPCNHIIFNNTD